MEQQDNKADQPKDRQYERLRETVAGVIREGFEEMKKKEMDSFVKSLDPMIKSIEGLIDIAKKEVTDLKLNMFKHKIALISFNGVIITLMVASKGKISFDLAAFVLLFLSIIVGLIQIMVYYFKNEYGYLDGRIIKRKLEAIADLCKAKRGDENTINDAKAFVRSIVLENRKTYDNVPALLKAIDQEHNLNRAFLKSLLVELLFFVPFIGGFALVLYQVYFYIS